MPLLKVGDTVNVRVPGYPQSSLSGVKVLEIEEEEVLETGTFQLLKVERFPGDRIGTHYDSSFCTRVYLCTCCHKNPVDPEQGYDTCDECLRKQ